MTPTEAALRAALESVKAALGDRLLAKGPLSKPYAHAVMREINAALAAPPHGKDAGEQLDRMEQENLRLRHDRNALQAELDEYRVTHSTGKEWLAQIASLQARLTEAEGLLREYLRPGRNSPEDLDGDTRAFLKKPPEGST